MAHAFSIALAQCNFTVGDIAGNTAIIEQLYQAYADKDVDLVICSEMAITGYPPEDLVLRPSFQQEAMEAIHHLASLTHRKTALLIGGIWNDGDKLYNTAFFLSDGKILHRYYKHHLPNYGVFDEKRVFHAGPQPAPFMWQGIALGILICEDTWDIPTVEALQKQGASLLISLNASPYDKYKRDARYTMAKKNVATTSLPLIYVNQIGGQDELVFDGGSFIIDSTSSLRHVLPEWKETTTLTHWQQEGKQLHCLSSSCDPPYEAEASVYEALKCGLKDYVRKNGFKHVAIGMSGGIDSALTAALAVDTLGKDHVHLVAMPSCYTSQESSEDASQCASLLGVHLDTIPIQPIVDTFTSTLAPLLQEKKGGTTEENIQSRSRGIILMALSNAYGPMLLTTGNKSEMSVGYATLYGDMCGGFNLLKDIYKTEVYKLAHWRNEQGKVIPDRILTKPPTAELRPDQTDQDTLPPYDILDAILIQLIEERRSVNDIITKGFDALTVQQVARMVKLAEYKRRQAPPGIKVTPVAFGRDRRYPITHRYHF